jgi:O-antigen/teichoic acid export membrane protein
LKDFVKQVSIYGILPVIGKFAGFFLIPIYARQFEAYEFGIVELLVTLAHFLMFVCSLEFYSAIGRYFYEKSTLQERKVLISTGLFLTVISTLTVVSLAFAFESSVISYYLKGEDYLSEYRISLIWLVFSALYTYLGVIPRYEKKPKVFVAINISSLFVRLGSTILYILVFDLGISGVLYGHLSGAVVASILNFFISYKYIGLHFNIKEAFRIIKFAVPIIPGLLVVGFWQPLSRNIISNFFSIKEVGLFAFAIRITSVLQMINLAVKLAWNPMIFENYKKDSFKKDLYRISKFMGVFSLFAATLLTLFAPEIALYVGTSEYADSSVLIGFLAFAGILEVLRRLRGFGPLLLKKTYVTSIVEIIGIGSGLILLFLLGAKIGLIGIGIAFVVPPLIKYILVVQYTQKAMYLNFFNYQELIIVIMLFFAIVLNMFNTAWYLRSFIAIVIMCYFFMVFGKQIVDKLKRKFNV